MVYWLIPWEWETVGLPVTSLDISKYTKPTMSAKSKVKKMKIWALTLEMVTTTRHSLCTMQSSNIIHKVNVHDYLVPGKILIMSVYQGWWYSMHPHPPRLSQCSAIRWLGPGHWSKTQSKDHYSAIIINTGCPKKNALLSLKAYNSGLEAAIWASKDTFGILRLWAFIWHQEVQDYVKASLRKLHLKLDTLHKTWHYYVTDFCSQ